MEPRPLLEHPQPAYPTRREFLAAGAAALAAAEISGCGTAEAASPRVAPIFAHGEGRGSTGCIVVSPPVFLSEEEALQVVKEELAKVGITLGEGMPLTDVTVKYEDPNMRAVRSRDNWLGEPSMTASNTADLAAVDRQQRVGVEVVTSDDCNRFRGGYSSSVQSYNTKALAQSVAEGIRAQAKQDLCVGVFYDPVEKWSFEEMRRSGTNEGGARDRKTHYKTVEESVKDKARAKLRFQVQDFVAWLKKNR